MAIGDVYRVVRQVYVDGEAHYNVLHFSSNTAEDSALDLLEALDDQTDQTTLNAMFRINMKGATSVVEEGWTIQKIYPTLEDAQFFPMTTYEYNDLSDGLPTFCAVCFQVKTGFASRSKRGRFYVGAIKESSTDGNVIKTFDMGNYSAIASAIEDWFMLGGAKFTGYKFGVWSRKNNEFTAATSVTPTSQIALLRRRKSGRGI